MRKTLLHLLIFFSFSLLSFGQKNDINEGIKYPLSVKGNSSDNYFGTIVADPYRWLENENSDSTKNWIKEQNDLTFSHLSQIPSREKLKQRLSEIWNYEKRSTPFSKNGRLFFYKNSGSQNQSLLYVQDSARSAPRLLIDPNTFSKDGTSSLGGIEISKNGKYIAYRVSSAGSDWNEIYVKDVETSKDLPDHLKWIKFSSIAWKGNGFFYSRYDAPADGHALSQKNENHKVYYHNLGDSQDKDELVYQDPQHPLRNFSPVTTDDENTLLLFSSESTSGIAIMIQDLTKPKQELKTIVDNFENEYKFIDKRDGKLYFLTDHKAPKCKLIAIDINNTSSENWQTIIPESNNLLENIMKCGNKLIVQYMKDVCSKLYIYTVSGNQESEIKLPGIGLCDHFNSEKNSTTAYFSFESVTSPPTIYKFDLTNNAHEIYYQPKINFDFSEYETKQVFYKSKDGTEIPMFITHKKDIQLNGNNPALLYGYGGFNISVTPQFKIERLALLEKGFVIAIANLRGGGEYGEEWHKSGTLCNKQNVFDDFIAAAEYLSSKKYTSPQKLAIHGRSNGGLLVGATITQRPDICKVALPGVGVLDMLRYHKFTIGWSWATDYGTSETPDQFNCIYKYSPLHNLKQTEYPATLITTADHDDRVVPAHSFKFAAAMQSVQQGNNPVMVRIDTKSGHGAGKPLSKQIEEFADMWAFVFKHLDVPY